jgi:hypothetical protein
MPNDIIEVVSVELNTSANIQEFIINYFLTRCAKLAFIRNITYGYMNENKQGITQNLIL